MSLYEDLKARIEAVESKLQTLEGSIILQLKQFVEFHTHTLGGKIVWEFPPELNKMLLAAYKSAIEEKRGIKTHNAGKEHLTLKDELEITITPGEVAQK